MCQYLILNLIFTVTNSTEFGEHGYDNSDMKMHPFFMARGPKIKINHKVDPFNTVDLLSLFCEILEIKASPNNGSFANVADVLLNAKSNNFITTVLIIGK